MQYALSPKRIYVLAEIGHKTSGFGNLKSGAVIRFSRLDQENRNQILDAGLISQSTAFLKLRDLYKMSSLQFSLEFCRVNREIR